METGARWESQALVLGILSEEGLSPAEPFTEVLATSAARVARDLGLPADWLNAGPTALLDLGLFRGFLDRAHRAEVGQGLVVFYADRYDQIHLKLYAMLDQAGGRHEEDLRALAPTPKALPAAAQWTTSHDPSIGFRQQPLLALGKLGVDDATLE